MPISIHVYVFAMARRSYDIAFKLKAITAAEQGRRKQISVGLAKQKFTYYDVMLNHRVGVTTQQGTSAPLLCYQIYALENEHLLVGETSQAGTHRP